MIVVTGGTGFLGQVVVRNLLSKGIRVRAIGRDPGRCARVKSLGADVVSADLGDAKAIWQAIRGAEAVIHAGALSAPFGPRNEFQAANIRGTENVVAACLNHKVGRLIHISSPAVVFDGCDQEFAREDVPYPRRDSSGYSWSKRIAEQVVRAAPLPWVILRPKAIFGEGDASLVPRLIKAARLGRLPQIGNGLNRVDLTYVENVAHAIALSVDAPHAVGGTYTITNDEHPQLWPVIRRLLEQCRLDTRLRRIPVRVALALARVLEARARIFGGEPLLTTYTAGILARTQTYDISAARRDLGYSPIVSFENGLERTLSALERTHGQGRI